MQGVVLAGFNMVRLFPFPEIRVQLLSPNKAKRVAEYAKHFLRFILFFDRILIAPFPFVYHALRPDQKLSARALSMSFLVVGFTFLPELFESSDNSMWSYKFPIELSLFLGYFLARVGWHEVAALVTALVLTVEYHYSVSQLPKVYSSVVQLSGLFVPFMLLVITNHWLIVLVFYFTNVFLFIFYISTYPPESGIQLEVNLIAVVISMMLYSSCAHNFNHWLLKQNEQRYVQFFRENFEAIAVVDWQGVVREVNQSFAMLFSAQKDTTPLEFVERSIFEFIHSENRSQIAKLFLSHSDHVHIGDLPRMEINGLRLDGQVIRVRMGLKMLRNFHGFSSDSSSNYNNEPVDIFSYGKQSRSTIFMLSFHDLTAHHQAQAAIVEAEREKHANDAKSKFLANMSHEIRTPLNGVLGMLQLLEDTPLNKEQRLFLKNSLDSANYLLLLINDILDFSKIEAGLLQIDEYEFKLAECIESVVDLLYSNSRTKGIDLYAFVNSRCPSTVLGDAARVRQVLMNLVSNAIKFTKKGKVLVQCDVIDSNAEDVPPNSLRLRFQVIDTGIGLKPENIDRLFQRFYQVDDQATLRRNHGGTGLGLAISRNLVGLMGGEIGVSSKYGEGSTFWFTLTCKKASPSGAPSPNSESPHSGHASNPRSTYADLPPQQLQQQLQHQLQKELHYQLHQQQSAARSYQDMPTISQLQQQQQQLQQQQLQQQQLQQQQHRPSQQYHVIPQQAQQHSPQIVHHPLAASGTAILDHSPPTTPPASLHSPPPTFSFVPPSTHHRTLSDGSGTSGSSLPLINVAIVIVSDNPHTRGILWDYFQAWGYTDVTVYKALEDGVKTILDRRDDERKLIIILCNKGNQLDPSTHDSVVHIKQKMPGEFPFFVLFIDKGNIKASIPKAILPQATLCYPIRQSQLYQIIMDIRDPAKQMVAPSPAMKNSREKTTATMPRVLYVDSSPTSRLMVKQTLQNDGIWCEAVPNYRDSLASLISLPSSPPVNNSYPKFSFDVVLVDVSSPCSGELTGIQCAEEIRTLEKKSFSGSRVPIIAVTADPAFSLAKSLECGMDGMCNFAIQNNIPFADLLISVVRQWLQHAPRLAISPAPSPAPSPSPTTNAPSPQKGGPDVGGAGAEGAPVKPAEQKKILVVEDNAMNQVVVSTFLKKAGYIFEFASDGQQGVDMYVSNPFAYQLILMDCQMPVMDGYEASIRIRENEKERKIRPIPIVAMTAAALVVDRERCLAVGMSDFVQKPIQRPLFLEILEKWLK
jgi:PAS domain S-box-containing protein